MCTMNIMSLPVWKKTKKDSYTVRQDQKAESIVLVFIHWKYLIMLTVCFVGFWALNIKIILDQMHMSSEVSKPT